MIFKSITDMMAHEPVLRAWASSHRVKIVAIAYKGSLNFLKDEKGRIRPIRREGTSYSIAV